MIVFLLANWRWLLPSAAAVGLGILLGFSRIEVADLHAAAAKTALAIQTQKTNAAEMLADETKRVRDAESKAADLNAQLEKAHADADAKTAAASITLNGAMSEWVRRHPPIRCGNGGQVANGANQGAAQPPDATPGSDERLPSGSAAFIQSCARAANILAASVRECHSFTEHLTCAP